MSIGNLLDTPAGNAAESELCHDLRGTPISRKPFTGINLVHGTVALEAIYEDDYCLGIGDCLGLGENGDTYVHIEMIDGTPPIDGPSTNYAQATYDRDHTEPAGTLFTYKDFIVYVAERYFFLIKYDGPIFFQLNGDPDIYKLANGHISLLNLRR